ncbi:MAG: esterase-like activity of phytase family protein [Hyphomonadaceae bacterium]|nr:esterase-like activity of phytase family protein [Hyphomonadaceae bacterium]
MRWRSLLCAVALAACGPSAADAPIAEQWRAVTLTATPVDFGAERIGALRFRGGLHLAADNHDLFGGLSGLDVLEDGRLIAVSDYGEWFEATLVLADDGALVGVADARAALLRDERGEPFEDKAAGDSEGLTQLPDGRFAVSFEQTQTIRIYDLNRDGPFGVAQAGPRLARTQSLPDNVGLEALAVTSEGALLVGAEGGGRRTTPLWIAPITAAAPVARATRYRPASGYSLTSLDRLPSGGFVALERFFAPVLGARARITRFSEDALGGEEISAEELALISPPLTLDNFEGVAAVRMSDGVTRLYIVSDDNFSDRQRTLLLAFDIVE